MKFFTVIPSKATGIRGCNAADEAREARLSIPLKGPAVVPRDPSTSLGMTRGTALAFFLCINFAITSASFAQADAEFTKANQDFAQGHFKEAITGYEALIRSGQWSANVFYDLGNAYFRTGDFGRSILNYERALALERHHPEATAFWLAIFAMFALIFKQRGSARAIALSICCLLVLAVAVYAIFTLERGSKGQALAVVTGKDVQARLATADTANSVLALPAGSEIKILSTRGDWIYAALPNNLRGWIPAKNAEQVRL